MEGNLFQIDFLPVLISEKKQFLSKYERVVIMKKKILALSLSLTNRCFIYSVCSCGSGS